MASLEERDERAARDLATLTYTLLGEARGEGVEGMVAVANVIRNRANSGIYPENPVDVVLEPWQFSTNNGANMGGGNQAQTRREVLPGSPLYLQAEAIAQRYIRGDGIDLTGGSLFYHVDGLAWRYADAVRGPYGTHVIGSHVFYPVHPVPQVNIGEADLLEGVPEPAPQPLPRASRPGGYSTMGVTRALSNIEEARHEMAVQRLVAANAEARRNEAMVLDSVRAANAQALDAQALNGVTGAAVTPELTDTAIIDNRPTFDARFDPARGAFVTNEQFIDEWLPSAALGPPSRVLGLGSLIGKSFPMVPPAERDDPTMPARSRVAPSSPPAAMPARSRVEPSAPPAPPIGPATQTTDPAMRTAISTVPASTPAPAATEATPATYMDTPDGRVYIEDGTYDPNGDQSRLPAGWPWVTDVTGPYNSRGALGAAMRDNPPVAETELITRKVRTIKIDPYTLQPVVDDDRFPIVPARVGDRGALERVTSAIGRAAWVPPTPLPRPDRTEPMPARSRVTPSSPPAPMPARSQVTPSAPPRAPVPLPPLDRRTLAEKTGVQPLGAPTPAMPARSRVDPTSSSSKSSTSTSAPVRPIISSATQTIDPTMRNAISSMGTAPTIITEVRTITVRQDGTSVVSPRSGDAQMPAGVRPAVPSTATVKPLSPPTQTIDPAMRNAISAIPAGLPMSVPPVPAPTIQRVVEAPAVAPSAPRTVTRQVVVRRVVTPPPPPRVLGESGRSYVVGGIYTASGNAYRVERDGSYTRVGEDPRYADLSPEQKYEAINEASRESASKKAGTGTTSWGTSKTTSTGESWAAAW